MAAGHRPRILIVDDSAVMRSLLRSVICSDARLDVAGTAADGASALASLPYTRPDLILLDVEMPSMDGLVTVRELRKRDGKLPVIMCSSLTRRGARETIDALSSGASDYVTKPAGQVGREAALRALAQELLPKIHVLLGPAGIPQACAPPDGRKAALPASSAAPSAPSIVAIGVSTGGPAALERVLPKLPADFPLAVLVVQHMPELFTGLFAERLNAHCNLLVCEAANGQAVRPGTIYVARGDWHLEVVASPLPGVPVTLHLHQGLLENHCRPAVDVLFRSVARNYGSGVVAVVLTGMGSDGLRGCRSVRENGGYVLVQDEASSTVWGMPGAVAGAGLANKILSLDAIAPEILRLAASTLAARPAVR